MKLNEVLDPTMKLRLEISKLRTQVEQQDQHINELLIDIGAIKRTMAELIKKLGPKK